MTRPNGDSSPMLTGIMLGVALGGGVMSIPQCAEGGKLDDRDLDPWTGRMVVIETLDVRTGIEVSRDRVTGRLCYTTVNGIWCESSASTLPDALRVTP